MRQERVKKGKARFLPVAALALFGGASFQIPEPPTKLEVIRSSPGYPRQVTTPVYLVAYSETTFEHGDGGHGEEAILKEFVPRWEAAQLAYTRLLEERDLAAMLDITPPGKLCTHGKCKSGESLPQGLKNEAIPAAALLSAESLGAYLDLKRTRHTLNGLGFLDGDKLVSPVLQGLGFYAGNNRYANSNPNNVIEVSRYQDGMCILVATLIDNTSASGMPDGRLDRIEISHPYPLMTQNDEHGEPVYKFIRGYGLRSEKGLEKVLFPPDYTRINMQETRPVTILTNRNRGGSFGADSASEEPRYKNVDTIATYFQDALNAFHAGEKSLQNLLK